MIKIYNVQLENILSAITAKELAEGNFGLELESLRVTKEGKLALTPHPEKFNEEPLNKLITNDFSESQIELVTPHYPSVDESYKKLLKLYSIASKEIKDEEKLWNQSIPGILPEANKIPIAQFKGNENASQLKEYRNNLLKRYDIKKQLISGIHFNFSFTDETLHKLHSKLNPKIAYKEFKDKVYLKIARNYIRYCWLIIYLTGASVGIHNSFTEEAKRLISCSDKKDGLYNPYACSLRNSRIGYKNVKNLHPNYNSIAELTNDLQSYIDAGFISNFKEFYSQIRLKPYDLKDQLTSLANDGINYIEIRTLDLNPFSKTGLDEDDLKFIHLFLIYCLLLEEQNMKNWQEEATYNEITVAENGHDPNIMLKLNGAEISFSKCALFHLNNLCELREKLDIYDESIVLKMIDRIKNPNNTYSKRLISIIKDYGFINSQIKGVCNV